MFVWFATARALRLLALALLSLPAYGLSVLTHEAVIDTLWDPTIKPLLLARFPDSTPEQLLEAHAYTYGGSIIQDMGYYPFGSHLFTNLVHYVRSADFVKNLIEESNNLNEYAFALGALSHYGADNSGHPMAVNRAVPILYPKLQQKYGDLVTYAEDPAAHLKVEFGFDVLQVARGRYAPQAYHDFIGFDVSKEVLERAFEKTYGLELKDCFKALSLAMGTYRYSVSRLIPEATKAAWAAKKKEIIKNDPGITRRKFQFYLSRASYHKHWGKEYERPGFFARLIATIFKFIPKFGPFKSLAFKTPTPQVEQMFEKSFETTVERDREYYAEVKGRNLNIPDTDLDTGGAAHAGEYPLADKTYAQLLMKLEEKHFATVTPDLRANILAFYGSGKVEDEPVKAALAKLQEH